MNRSSLRIVPPTAAWICAVVMLLGQIGLLLHQSQHATLSDANHCPVCLVAQQGGDALPTVATSIAQQFTDAAPAGGGASSAPSRHFTVYLARAPPIVSI